MFSTYVAGTWAYKKQKGEYMGKNTIMPKDHEKTPGKSRVLSKEKYNHTKLNEGQGISKSDYSKLMALQDALQDPITNCEGF